MVNGKPGGKPKFTMNCQINNTQSNGYRHIQSKNNLEYIYGFVPLRIINN